MKKLLYLILLLQFNATFLFGQANINASKNSISNNRKYQNITAILGAFPAEVTLIQSFIQQKKELVYQNTHFTEGTLNGKHVVLAQTGVGKVNAAITTTLLLDHFAPREVLFTGIAGGIDSTLLPGDLVIGSKIAYHDFGTLTPNGIVLRATKNPATQKDNPMYFSCDSILITLAENVGKQIVLQKPGSRNGNRLPKIVTGTIITGDVFVASVAATKLFQQKMNAVATEMEGAAVGQACWQQKVPFLVIRSLSDNAGNSAYGDVAAFYKIAAENSAAMVLAILKKL